MLELWLSVCKVNEPDVCREVVLNSASHYEQCMMDLASMAKWVGENPQWTIKKWHCSKAGQEANL